MILLFLNGQNYVNILNICVCVVKYLILFLILIYQKFIEIAKENEIEYLSIHTAATAKNKKFDWYKKINEIYPKRTHWKFGLDGFADVSHIYRTNQDSEFLFDTMIKLKELGANVENLLYFLSMNIK